MNRVNIFAIVLFITTLILTLDQQETYAASSEWSYSIIGDTTYHQFKRTVEVRLSERIPKTELTDLAIKIKAMDSKKYERTFITYYLPEMEVGHGAWATSHYDPDLKVQILGTTKEENDHMKVAAQQKNIDRVVIGTWYIEAPYASRTLTLFRKDKKVFMERTFKDGSSSIREMTEVKTPKGMKYQEVGSDNDSDYYIINAKGEIEVRDSEGLIDTGKII